MNTFPRKKKLSTKKLLATLAVLFCNACNPDTNPLSQLQNTRKKLDNVLVQCFAPQGNGGNWASTLAWLGEQTIMRAEQAMDLEKSTGKTQGIYLGCMFSGSSGAVAVNVFHKVLQNPFLSAHPGTQSIFTPEETMRLGKAMRFIAVTVDFNINESIGFWSHALPIIIDGSLSPWTDKISRMFGDKSAHWWGGEKVDGDRMLENFATILTLAETLDEKTLALPVSAFLSTEEQETALRYGMKTLSDLPSFSSLQDVPTKESREGQILAHILDAQSRTANNAADRIVNAPSLQAQRTSQPLMRTFDSAEGTGFCTAVMAAFYSDKSKVPLDTPPHYSQLRPVLLCGEETAQLLLRSELYRSDILSRTPFADRFVIAVVPKARNAVFASIREPGFMREYFGEARNPDLNIVSFYDPLRDRAQHGTPTFQLQRTSEELNPVLALAGGFPDHRLNAWMLSYFQLEITKRLLSEDANHIQGYLARFGKPDALPEEPFPDMAIRKIFSSSPSDAATNVRDWKNFENGWCETFEKRFSEANIRDQFVGMVWDLAPVPAAQMGMSRFLVVKAANATRHQISLNDPETVRHYVFDPSLTSEHVRFLNEPYPCRNDVNPANISAQKQQEAGN